MDVCLTNYGHCNYVSGKHACIFYDEVRGGDGVGESSSNLRPILGAGVFCSVPGSEGQGPSSSPFLPSLSFLEKSLDVNGHRTWPPAPQDQGSHFC